MITCTGASLGYGIAQTNPYIKTLLQGVPHPAHEPAAGDPGGQRLEHRLRAGDQMSKKAPSTTQLLVITGFALSCFGILLFLWITFGGPTPFKAKSYEVTIPFDEAAQLAQQSDVRISGVNVGKVKNIERDPGKLAIATIEIDDKYAPIPKDTRAILRTKTLLAETYVELTPGNRNGPKLAGRRRAAGRQRRPLGPDRRDLPHLRPEDPRRLPGMDAERSRSRSTAAGRTSRPAFGELDTTFTEFDELFRTLDTQEAGRQPALQQRRRRPRRLPRPRRPARRPGPQLEQRLHARPPPATATSKRCSAPSRPSRTSRA